LPILCEAEGFTGVRTYIASGNVVFDCDTTPARARAALEQRLLARAGRPVGVQVRTAAEMAAVLAANPFPDQPGNRTVAIFLDAAPPAGALQAVRNQRDERLALGRREIYVAYGAGMADSKLLIPAAGTARNMNTVARLAAMAQAG